MASRLLEDDECYWGNSKESWLRMYESWLSESGNKHPHGVQDFIEVQRERIGTNFTAMP